MKLIYLITLIVSIPITLVLFLVCIPMVLIGAIGNSVLKVSSEWLTLINDNMSK